MKGTGPGTKAWRELYDAAVAFRELACWEWMWDCEIVGVQDPATGEVGHCCVMGRAGEHYGLAAYLGTAGLDGYLAIADADPPPPPSEALHLNRCLMASFEDRGLLDREDMKVVKRLGLRFRGRNAWPLFRSYEPGFQPWYLTSREAGFLALCLRQTMDVAVRFRDDPGLLEPPDDDRPMVFVRVPSGPGASPSWREEWREPPPSEPPELSVPPVDGARLAELGRSAARGTGAWEADVYWSPCSVQEGRGRPWYPHLVLWVDAGSGLILDLDMAQHGEWPAALRGRLVAAAEGGGPLPGEVRVSRPEAFLVLAPVARALGVGLVRVDRLGALDEAKASLSDIMAGRA